MKAVRITLAALTLLILISSAPASGQDNQADEHHQHKHHHYQLIDLGTLGGAQSTMAGGRALNDQGTVVG